MDVPCFLPGEKGGKVLVLGAFDCGVFSNPPTVVAKAFKAVQEKYDSCFETIEYAVFCGEYETKNYEAFCESNYKVAEGRKAIMRNYHV